MNNIAEKLIKGSHNIDKMKAGIRQVLGMLMSDIVAYRMWAENGDYITFTGDGWNWVVEKPSEKGAYHIECEVRTPTEKYPEARDIGYNGDDGSGVFPSLNGVEPVYDSLPLLVEELFKRFPELRQICAPILEAADKF